MRLSSCSLKVFRHWMGGETHRSSPCYLSAFEAACYRGAVRVYRRGADPHRACCVGERARDKQDGKTHHVNMSTSLL